MFIGEGPGWQEERDGHPFIGRSGNILRRALKTFGIEDIAYISNVVACRSCEQATDGTGQPIFTTRGGVRLPKWKDVTPPSVAVEACLPRLYEEIYLVDPVLVVTLGVPASQALLGRPVKITKERGTPQQFSIPGASVLPSLTEKKGAWRRDADKKLVVETNQVRYLLLPTLHPAHVLRMISDQGERSPFRQFAEDIKLATKIYNRYMLETYGNTAVAEIPTTALETLQNELFSEDA
jgi:uracil-DNA glycosylase